MDENRLDENWAHGAEDYNIMWSEAPRDWFSRGFLISNIHDELELMNRIFKWLSVLLNTNATNNLFNE